MPVLIEWTRIAATSSFPSCSFNSSISGRFLRSTALHIGIPLSCRWWVYEIGSYPRISNLQCRRRGSIAQPPYNYGFDSSLVFIRIEATRLIDPRLHAL